MENNNSRKKLINVLLLLVGLPLLVYVVITGIKYLTNAITVPVTLAFSPQAVTMAPNSTNTLHLVLDGKTNKIGFAKVGIIFDPTKIQLTDEVVTSTRFANVITKTTKDQANTTGKIVVTMAVPGGSATSAPTGSFELLAIPVRATALVNTQTAVTINDTDVQIVDLTPGVAPFTKVNASVSIATPGPSTVPGVTATPQATANATPATGDLNIAVCDPSHGGFSLNINNPYFPLPVGKQWFLSDGAGTTVRMTVLNQTEVVAGITTRVVEEYETANGVLAEISRNYYVQASDGTVCYYGEAVDIYTNGQITSHEGAWRAEGSNKPGIFMPANATVGQSYYQEIAPGVAEDKAIHVRIEPSFTTPAGTFNNVLYVEEIPSSTKRYAPGVGLVSDGNAVLTFHTGGVVLPTPFTTTSPRPSSTARPTASTIATAKPSSAPIGDDDDDDDDDEVVVISTPRATPLPKPSSAPIPDNWWYRLPPWLQRWITRWFSRNR